MAVSKVEGGAYREEGIDIPKLQAGGDWKGAGKTLSNKELLELDVDVLVPAAIENQITSANAENVRARVLLEMANAPVDAQADGMLESAGVKVVPDVVANAGGVVVSFFEWMQNLSGESWSEEEVSGKLEARMTQSFHEVARESVRLGASLRHAAYALAINRILEAESARGNR